MSDFIKVAKIGDILPDAPSSFSRERRPVAIFNIGGVYYAIDDRCPHRGGPLSEGALEVESSLARGTKPASNCRREKPFRGRRHMD